MGVFLGDGTIALKSAPSIISTASIAGTKEGKGPLKDSFDYIADDVKLGTDSWEKAESIMQQYALKIALQKSGYAEKDIDFLFAGDLLNQCVASGYAMRDFNIPFIGLYGACSTMAESMAMASIFVESGIANQAAALTSSHFCSAERQFRYPLNYGGVRTPTAQWTATASGCAIIGKHAQPPYIQSVTIGKIDDRGIKDAANMGAAMAGAAYSTITAHFANTGTNPKAYDMIFTGDLGQVGRDILLELFLKDNIELKKKHNDCGLMLFDMEEQDVGAGASGCGCSASVFCGHIMKEMQKGKLKNILFVATGALMSTTMQQQGESIPGIAHALHISAQ